MKVISHFRLHTLSHSFIYQNQTPKHHLELIQTYSVSVKMTRVAVLTGVIVKYNVQTSCKTGCATWGLATELQLG